MTTNDLYVRMLVDHPIQKEWKPKAGDKTDVGILDVLDIGVIKEANSDLRRHYTWLLRQEDWQEKYYDKAEASTWIGVLNDFYDFVESYPNHSLAYDLTILWCLFVSKEVYGLEWDWEKNCWCQLKQFQERVRE